MNTAILLALILWIPTACLLGPVVGKFLKRGLHS